MRRTYKENGKRVDLVRQQRFDVEPLTEIIVLNHKPQKELLCELVFGSSAEDIPFAKLVSFSVLQLEMIESRFYNKPVQRFDRPVYPELHHVSRERNRFISCYSPSHENPKTAPDQISEFSKYLTISVLLIGKFLSFKSLRPVDVLHIYGSLPFHSQKQTRADSVVLNNSIIVPNSDQVKSRLNLNEEGIFRIEVVLIVKRTLPSMIPRLETVIRPVCW